MKFFGEAQIRANLQLRDLIEPVAEAFKAFSRGASSDAIAHLHPNDGEVHIKGGFVTGGEYFAVKVSGGFPGNTQRGLPVWDGVMLAFDAHTGMPAALLHDQGLLTDWRTAAAGAIASKALAPASVKTIGVIGTGLQAYWQPLAHRVLFDFERLLIWGRDAAKSEALRARLALELSGIEVEVAADLRTLARASEVIVSATSSTQSLLQDDWIGPGTHITAIGADAPGKQELDTAILARAEWLVVDSIEANKKYGDVACALREGTVEMQRLIELGDWLERPRPRAESAVTVAKLIGLGVQDLAAVDAAMRRLN